MHNKKIYIRKINTIFTLQNILIFHGARAGLHRASNKNRKDKNNHAEHSDFNNLDPLFEHTRIRIEISFGDAPDFKQNSFGSFHTDAECVHLLPKKSQPRFNGWDYG